MRTTVVHIPVQQHREMKRLAKAEGRKLSAVIADVVARGLKERRNEKDFEEEGEEP